MQTHQYTRYRRRHGTMDAYNSLAKQYPEHFSTVEYWSNGTVTHLMSSVKAETVNPSTVQTLSSRRPTLRRQQSSTREGNVVRNSILAGSIAGITSTLACYPFDVLRTKMQSAAIETVSSSAKSRTASISAVSARTAVAGPIQVLTVTLQHGGIRALYTGLALPLAAQAVYKSTVFAVNNVSKQALVEWKTQERLKTGIFQPYSLTLGDRFLCGFIGGAINAALFVTPVEYVRNQLIAQHTRLAQGIVGGASFSGPWHVIRSTVSANGVSRLWRGLAVTVARDSLGCGCYFVAFTWVHNKVAPKHQAASTWIAGGVAGLAYWAVALPLDTVKTWIQNGSASSATQAVTDSFSKHGLTGTASRLCRGWQVAFGRGVPAAAITLGTYEASYKYFQDM